MAKKGRSGSPRSEDARRGSAKQGLGDSADKPRSTKEEGLSVDPADVMERLNAAIRREEQRGGFKHNLVTPDERAIRVDPFLPRKVQDARDLSRRMAEEEIARRRAAVEINPDNSEAHNHLARALLTLGRNAEAIDEFRAAVKFKPYNAYIRSDLAHALFEDGQIAEAIAEFGAVVKIKPNDARLRSEYGRILLQNGQTAAAVTEFSAVVKISPSSPNSHYDLGIAFLQNGQLAGAIAELRTAVKGEENLAKAHHYLGYALFKRGRIAEAIAEYRSAIELDPDDADVHTDLGAALLQGGHIAEAVAEFGAVVKIRPDDAFAHCNLGIALFKNGEMGRAISAHAKALDLDPNNSKARDNFRILINEIYRKYFYVAHSNNPAHDGGMTNEKIPITLQQVREARKLVRTYERQQKKLQAPAISERLLRNYRSLCEVDFGKARSDDEAVIRKARAFVRRYDRAKNGPLAALLSGNDQLHARVSAARRMVQARDRRLKKLGPEPR